MRIGKEIQNGLTPGAPPPTYTDAIWEGVKSGILAGSTAGALSATQACLCGADLSVFARASITSFSSGATTFSFTYVVTGDTETAIVEGVIAVPAGFLGPFVKEGLGTLPKILVGIDITLIKTCGKEGAEFWEGW